MTPYLFVFFLTLTPAIIKVPRWYQGFLYIIYIFFIGLRFEVGGDWDGYIFLFENSEFAPWLGSHAISHDFAYHWLNKLAIILNQDIYFINFAIAIVFVSCLFIFCKELKNPYLGLTVAFPYLTTVVAMGYTRQSAAIGFEMLAILALAKRRKLIFFVYLLLGTLFHKSLLIAILIPLLMKIQESIQEKKVINIIALIILALFTLISAGIVIEATSRFADIYLTGQLVSSSGAAIRLLMNLLPAIIFLLEYYRGNNFFSHSSNAYLALSWLVILSFLLLIVGLSTLADRLALYLIPIQLYVLGNLPYLFFPKQRELFFRWLFLVIGYSSAVLWVWLKFSNHASEWLPYRMYPFI